MNRVSSVGNALQATAIEHKATRMHLGLCLGVSSECRLSSPLLPHVRSPLVQATHDMISSCGVAGPRNCHALFQRPCRMVELAKADKTRWHSNPLEVQSHLRGMGKEQSLLRAYKSCKQLRPCCQNPNPNPHPRNQACYFPTTFQDGTDPKCLQ